MTPGGLACADIADSSGSAGPHPLALTTAVVIVGGPMSAVIISALCVGSSSSYGFGTKSASLVGTVSAADCPESNADDGKVGAEACGNRSCVLYESAS